MAHMYVAGRELKLMIPLTMHQSQTTEVDLSADGLGTV